MRPKVVHILGTADREGLQIVVLALIKALPEFTHSVIFNGVEEGALYEDFAAVAAVRRCPYFPRRTLGFALRLKRSLQEEAPDVVLAHLFGNHTLVSWAAALARVPVVFGVSANDPVSYSESRWWPMLLAHAARPFCRAEIAVSAAVGHVLSTQLRLPARRIVVIPNGCPVAEIASRASAARRNERRAGQPPRILMAAHMSSSRNQDLLLHAVAVLKRQDRVVELCLAGSGWRRPQLEQLARGLGIAHATRFLGSRSDVPELMGVSDVFVHATYTDGFGLVLVEAMAAEIPVIATSIPATREVLGEGRYGLLVPQGDAEALARAIASLLDDPDLRERLVAAASVQVRLAHDISRMAAGYGTLMRRHMGSTPRPKRRGRDALIERVERQRDSEPGGS